jgi:hypothetical protein
MGAILIWVETCFNRLSPPKSMGCFNWPAALCLSALPGAMSALPSKADMPDQRSRAARISGDDPKTGRLIYLCAGRKGKPLAHSLW